MEENKSWVLYCQDHQGEAKPSSLGHFASLKRIREEVRAQAFYATVSQPRTYAHPDYYFQDVKFPGWDKEIHHTFFKIPDDESYPDDLNYLPIAIIGNHKAFFAIKVKPVVQGC